jgi:hypothetical protein
VSGDWHWFRWALDERGKPWVIHQCLTLMAWRLPPPWTMQDGRPYPSLDCAACGCHVFVTVADEVPMTEVEAVLEARK